MIDYVSDFFRLGGSYMWPLAACSVALLAFLFERVVVTSSERWRPNAQDRTLHKRILPFFVEVAPALGLLGTMQGIIDCFSVMGGAGAGENALKGLGGAAITSVAGLLIALVATVANYALDMRIETEKVAVTS